MLRCAFHGRDGEDNQSNQESDPAGSRGWLLARRFVSSRPTRSFFAKAFAQELLRHCLHQLQRRCESAFGYHLYQRQCGESSRERPSRSQHSLCSRSKSWLLGHGEDRAKNGSVARSLLRARRVYSKQHQCDPRSLSKCSRCRAPGMYLRGPNVSGRSLLDREDGKLLPIFQCGHVHYRHRVRDASSSQERSAEQNFYSGSYRQLFLCGLPVHEAEYARKTSGCSRSSPTGDRSSGDGPATGGLTDRTNAGFESVNQHGALVIGAGPAGLRAAEILASAGIETRIFEQKSSLGRKFLVAGGGGGYISQLWASSAFFGGLLFTTHCGGRLHASPSGETS